MRTRERNGAARAIAFCCLALAALPRSAAAEWHITPMIGLTFRGNTSIVDPEHASTNTRPSVGGAVTLLGGGIFGVEAITSLTPGFFQADSTIVQSSRTFALMGNAVVTAPRRLTEYSLRPFISGGLGLLRASKTDVLPFHANLVGLNIGGGAIGFLSARTGLRFDVRYYSTLNASDLGGVAFGKTHLSYMSASVGLVFRR